MDKPTWLDDGDFRGLDTVADEGPDREGTWKVGFYFVGNWKPREETSEPVLP